MRRSIVVAALLPLLLATACTEDRTEGESTVDGAVVVASFNFAESELLAELYAQALEDEGIVVRRELALGQRELVLPALRRGLVDVVPEYAGSALDATSTASPSDPSDVDAAVAALRDAVAPWGIAVLEPSPASNQNVVTVTAELATRHDLRTIGDLRPLAADLVAGGPPECPRRPRCLPGLAHRYGVDFAEFVPLAGADLVHRALADGVVDVGVFFSTDAALGDDELVVLEDDRQLQPPDNVVALVRRTALADGRLGHALEEVSARLTTTSLRFLNWRIENAGTSIADEAHGWLVRHDLVDR